MRRRRTRGQLRAFVYLGLRQLLELVLLLFRRGSSKEAEHLALPRLLARTLPRYDLGTPDRVWRHFLDNTGTVTVAEDHVRVDLALRTYTPVLIDASFTELDIPIPWWGGRSLRFDFPPR